MNNEKKFRVKHIVSEYEYELYRFKEVLRSVLRHILWIFLILIGAALIIGAFALEFYIFPFVYDWKLESIKLFIFPFFIMVLAGISLSLFGGIQISNER
ncbi:MAG: hypothetical protein IJA32_10995 [Lachnospiraceae bacterium]|nr:hypothetical protein [Lachnospiraceae bacterium]